MKSLDPLDPKRLKVKQRQRRAGKAMTDPEMPTQRLDRHTRAGYAMTHDPLCLAAGKPTSWEPEMCVCDLIAKVRQDEREQSWERGADAVYETTDGLAALKIRWSINPESRPHEIGWRCYKTGAVEVCKRCGENWPCSALQEKIDTPRRN